MDLVWRRFDRGLNIVVCLIYATLTVVAFAQVVVRYALGGSLPWSEEAVRFLFIWLSFLGFSITMNRGGHIGVEFFVDLFPRPMKRMLALASDTLIAGFLVFLAVEGTKVAQITMNNRSPAMQIPMGYMYMIFPISSVILIVYTLRVTYRHWQGDFGPWK